MWNQPNLFSGPERALTVSEVTSRIRTLLEREPAFRDLWVEGEVSNFSRASSGHIYFTLKDAGASISCVVWRSQAYALSYLPRSGDQIRVHGRIGVYEAGGRYQIYVDHAEPAGRGSLYQEYERLKARLETEGLFAPERKRPLPAYPRCIGVVTSPTAAALQDVLNVLRRRYPQIRVILAPTQVQGESAPPRIVAALSSINARREVDLVLLVRGGGSLEDLWAFNDERVARAVAASRVPIVSGVGHETDFSLADFAADVRAPTPSAAAEMATPDCAELRLLVRRHHERLERALEALQERLRRHVERTARTLEYLSPAVRLSNAQQQLDGLTARADVALVRRREQAAQRLETLAARLESLNPEAVLQRGYAIVRRRSTQEVIASVEQTRPGQPLEVQLQDGEVPVRVEGAMPLRDKGFA
ncbi:MAG: exodeoxyribonuclease VII large subunit [Anaerolineales bacterium]